MTARFLPGTRVTRRTFLSGAATGIGSIALASALLAGPTAPAQPSTRMWPQGFIEVPVAGGKARLSFQARKLDDGSWRLVSIETPGGEWPGRMQAVQRGEYRFEADGLVVIADPVFDKVTQDVQRVSARCDVIDEPFKQSDDLGTFRRQMQI